jgi:hypothetical protein
LVFFPWFASSFYAFSTTHGKHDTHGRLCVLQSEISYSWHSCSSATKRFFLFLFIRFRV